MLGRYLTGAILKLPRGINENSAELPVADECQEVFGMKLGLFLRPLHVGTRFDYRLSIE